MPPKTRSSHHQCFNVAPKQQKIATRRTILVRPRKSPPKLTKRDSTLTQIGWVMPSSSPHTQWTIPVTSDADDEDYEEQPRKMRKTTAVRSAANSIAKKVRTNKDEVPDSQNTLTQMVDWRTLGYVKDSLESDEDDMTMMIEEGIQPPPSAQPKQSGRRPQPRLRTNLGETQILGDTMLGAYLDIDSEQESELESASKSSLRASQLAQFAGSSQVEMGGTRPTTAESKPDASTSTRIHKTEIPDSVESERHLTPSSSIKSRRGYARSPLSERSTNINTSKCISLQQHDQNCDKTKRSQVRLDDPNAWSEPVGQWTAKLTFTPKTPKHGLNDFVSDREIPSSPSKTQFAIVRRQPDVTTNKRRRFQRDSTIAESDESDPELELGTVKRTNRAIQGTGSLGGAAQCWQSLSQAVPRSSIQQSATTGRRTLQRASTIAESENGDEVLNTNFDMAAVQSADDRGTALDPDQMSSVHGPIAAEVQSAEMEASEASMCPGARLCVTLPKGRSVSSVDGSMPNSGGNGLETTKLRSQRDRNGDARHEEVHPDMMLQRTPSNSQTHSGDNEQASTAKQPDQEGNLMIIDDSDDDGDDDETEDDLGGPDEDNKVYNELHAYPHNETYQQQTYDPVNDALLRDEARAWKTETQLQRDVKTTAQIQDSDEESDDMGDQEVEVVPSSQPGEQSVSMSPHFRDRKRKLVELGSHVSRADDNLDDSGYLSQDIVNYAGVKELPPGRLSQFLPGVTELPRPSQVSTVVDDTQIGHSHLQSLAVMKPPWTAEYISSSPQQEDVGLPEDPIQVSPRLQKSAPQTLSSSPFPMPSVVTSKRQSHHSSDTQYTGLLDFSLPPPPPLLLSSSRRTELNSD